MVKAKLNLEVAHQIPGRIRMKIPSAKGNPELLGQIKETFGVIPGIEQILVNPTTGSVILLYDRARHDDFQDRLQQQAGAPNFRPPTNEIDRMADTIRQEAEFLAEHSHAARMVVDFFKELDLQIRRASGNLIDFKIVLAILVVGVTVFEVGVGAATPVWVTLVIFGLNHFVEMHRSGANPASDAAMA